MDGQSTKTSKANTAQLPQADGVTFGVRGCLTTFAGLVIGAVVGVSLPVLLWHYNVLGYDEGEFSGLALMVWKFVGGVSGATFGAFLGVIIGTRRR